MQTTALIIFIITYIGIIFTRLPKMNIDRPSAAFFGAVAMILFGVVTFDEAIRAIDFNTIALLLGMMIIVATLELDGFFGWIATRTMAVADTPFKLLTVLSFTTGIASAFLVNDAVVLLFTPVSIGICRSLKLNPVPFLIAEILSSNIGSAMTITGNPQNMLIGINSGISYGHFLLFLLPVSISGMLVIVYFVKWYYPSVITPRFPETNKKTKPDFATVEKETSFNYRSMRFSVPIFILVIILFFLSRPLNLSIPLISLIGASLILLLGRIKPSKVIRQVDWVLLLFFASLFIVVHAVEKAGLMEQLLNHVKLTENGAGLAGIHMVSLLLSQIVSNVPFTVVMLPLMKTANSEVLWLALASASTLAGNATIIGAMANLIVIETAESKGVKIRFMEFFRIGIVVTLISMILSFGIIYFQMLVR
jgi:Na+/H+ antiporter NhaD/arsenite permease-like protein